VPLLVREPKEALEPEDEEPGPLRELELKELCWPLPELELKELCWPLPEAEGAPYWELGAEPERSLDEKPELPMDRAPFLEQPWPL
jgi:hypothetical protein